jgi:hypothetical protein
MFRKSPDSRVRRFMEATAGIWVRS